MAIYRPVIANSIDDFEAAIKNSEAVIIMTNKHLIPKIKSQVEHDKNVKKKSGSAMKIGALLTVAGGVVAFLSGGTALIIGGALANVLGLFSLGGGAIVKILNALSAQLRNYKWFQDDKKEFLVVYKYSGANKMDFEKDDIDYSELEKAMRK